MAVVIAGIVSRGFLHEEWTSSADPVDERWHSRASCAERGGTMAHSYEELRKKTLAELRAIAKELTHESVQGSSQMNKDHLLPALCTALGIDAHVHHAAHGEQKVVARARLKELRTLRAQAIAAH